MKKLLTLLFAAAIGLSLSLPAMAQDNGSAPTRKEERKEAKRHHHRRKKARKHARKEERKEEKREQKQ